MPTRAFKTTIVVPCYNEAKRLLLTPFSELAAAPGVTVLFVDDGSTDDTRRLLTTACAAEARRLRLLPLEENSGKAEAVRRGMRAALADGAELVGFLDADGATPPAEMLRLREVMIATNAAAVLGSRVRRLGAQIERNELRHYVGRVFATGASMALRLPVYDTQCGAKLFRRSRVLEAALAQPFACGWVFDVELLQRLLIGSDGVAGLPAAALVEVPLNAWSDVRGSKVRPWHAARAAYDLLRLGVRGRR